MEFRNTFPKMGKKIIILLFRPVSKEWINFILTL